MAITIPKSDQKALLSLGGMTNTEFDSLMALFESAAATDTVEDLKSRDTFAQFKAVLADFLPFVLRLRTAVFDRTTRIPDFVNSICARAESSGLKVKDHDWDTIRQRLTKVLQVTSLLATQAKMRAIGSEYERVYCDTKVVSDMRPLFSDDLEPSTLGVAIRHSLRLRYHSDSGRDSMTVAMTLADLEDLIAQLQRAVVKEKSLEGFLSGKDVKVFKDEQ